MVNRLVSIDTADNQMPDPVRDQLAANFTNPEMVEGAALVAGFVAVVTPEQFGAAGDGVTDDTTAVQSALSAADSGVLVRGAPSSTYRIVDPVTITAEGATVQGLNLLYDDTTASVEGDLSAFTVLDCTSVTLDEVSVTVVNQAQQYSGISVRGSAHTRLRRPRVHNARWAGIDVIDSGASVCIDTEILEPHVTQNRFGIVWDSNDVLVQGGYISSEWSQTQEFIDKGGVWDSTSLYYDGIIIGTGAEEFVISGVTIVDNGQSGIYSMPCANGAIIGNKIKGNWNKGIDLAPTGTKSDSNRVRLVSIIGNVVIDNATGNIHGYHMDDCTISNNTSLLTSAATTTNCIMLNGVSLRNVVAGNTLSTAGTPSALFINSVQGSRDTTVLGNTIVGSTPYSVTVTENTVIDGYAGTKILSALKAVLAVDLSALSGFSGREALKLTASADNTYVQVTANKKIRFTDSVGTRVALEMGGFDSSAGGAVTSGLFYLGNAVDFRLPQTEQTGEGRFWYDPTTQKLKFRDASGTRTVTSA